MKTTFYKFVIFAVMLMLFTLAIDSANAQEGPSTNLKMVPSQERIPTANWRIDPDYIIPPIVSPPVNLPSSPAERYDAPPAPAPVESPVVPDSPSFKAPLVSSLERGKWYVQIGAYTKAEYVENAVNRVGTSSPVVIHSVDSGTNPMFRVLLGPFSQSESKTMLQRFKDKGYDAFLRSGN